MGLDPETNTGVIQDIELVNEADQTAKAQEAIEDYDLDDIVIGGPEEVDEDIEYETIRVPINKKKNVYAQTWKPANLIEIPERFKDHNFTYYCANWKQGGRLLKLQNEGWVIDKHIMPRMEKSGMTMELLAGTIQDGVQKDNTLRFRELVVLRMPKETAEARARYFRAQNPLGKKLKDEDNRLYEGTKGRSYGNIKVKRGG